MQGQSLNISGTINPTPTLPDSVLIQVQEQSTVGDIDSGTAAVQTGGMFSYSIVIGSTWDNAIYIITVTDSYGASGSENIVVNSMPFP